MFDNIEIIELSVENREWFKSLNYEWIESLFVVEPTDERVLSNPEKEIIGKGGFVFFAQIGQQIVGTFALMKVDETTYEMAKMAVTKAYQGRGIGQLLLVKAIQKAEELNAGRVVLYTHSKLDAALAIYRKQGFRDVAMTGFHNNRANIMMELLIENWQYR